MEGEGFGEQARRAILEELLGQTNAYNPPTPQYLIACSTIVLASHIARVELLLERLVKALEREPLALDALKTRVKESGNE